MPDQKLLALARDARERAEEIFTGTETFQDEYAKQKMREIAAKYEELAEKLEQAAK
jgi:plasmid stabilization system protein ParE